MEEVLSAAQRPDDKVADSSEPVEFLSVNNVSPSLFSEVSEVQGTGPSHPLSSKGLQSSSFETHLSRNLLKQ